MNKNYLISYQPTQYQALNTGFTYELKIVMHKFWGLIKKEKTVEYEIPDWTGTPLKTYTDHWDSLIKNRTPLTGNFKKNSRF